MTEIVKDVIIALETAGVAILAAVATTGLALIIKKLRPTQNERLAKLEAKRAKNELRIKKAKEKLDAEIKELAEAKAKLEKKI